MNTLWNSQAQTLSVVMSKADALQYAYILECWYYDSDTEEATQGKTDAKQIRLCIPRPHPGIDTPKGREAQSSAG